MELGLKGKRVLITGASRGIGAAIARSFLVEGANVCIISRGLKQLYVTEKSLVAEFGADRVISNECDCTNSESLQGLKDSVASQWNGLDIVVANVGDGRSVADALPDDEQWKKNLGQ